MRQQNVRTLSLVVCTFTYLLIGAAVFDALESDTETERLRIIETVRQELLGRYNISGSEYKLIETVIIENQPHKAGPQWKFAGALYFVTVVVAMIGYGHSTPETVGGKAFCIVYAVVGIPLGMVMFQSIGERLNKFTSVIIKKMKKMLGCTTTEATDVNQLCVTGTLSSIVMTAGAAVFSHYENWNYIDAFYYCFITLTTIGFGDFVALQKENALTTKPGYVALSLVFILFGLTVVAASINLLVLRFMTMNTDEVKAGDYEMQDASQSVVTLDGELMAINGKLLAGTHESELGEGRVGSYTSIATVCSCTCYPRPHHSPTDSRHRYSIVRSPSRISNLLVEQGGGSKIDPHQSDQFPPLLHDSFMVANYLKTKRSSV
ncbi:two pore potassium channel protein sup-9-like [Homarus americanus]|uniref:Two pore potassium channel subfamily K member 2 n=1 Tax=Homarus americanus TaxID=6706 RepID=A0A1C9TAA8_HOMAM|nr:two pore potassium channel protein sup-9-like [Homarus americanus]AOR07230.1 two pore potassium channel subfamily K member 2 [Homarus americanus]